jgi:hypothetical protein
MAKTTPPAAAKKLRLPVMFCTSGVENGKEQD